MPAVGAALASFAGSIATGTFASTAVGSFLTKTFVGRLLTSVAFSALKVALAGKPKTKEAGIRTKATQTGGVNPASFVLGKYPTEGQLQCPPMSHGQEGKTPNAYLTYVIEVGDIPGQALDGLILDGERVEFGQEAHADYGTPILGRFTDHAWVRYYNGSQTAADPMLLDKYGDYPDRPWQADMISAGICYAILTFRFNREIFGGFPKVRFEMSGIPLYDPRYDSSVGGTGDQRWADRSTWQPTENVAVQVYNIKRGIDLGGGHIWGGSAEAEDLPLSTWWAAMNQADFAVALDGGGTEPQWRSSYEVFVNDEPAKVIEDMLRGCSGQVVENGGIWKIRLGGPGLPVYYFTDDDVILSEPAENTPFSASRTAYNGVQAIYPDPAALWEPKDAPALYSAAYEAQDGGQRRVAELTLNATPYPRQVQQVQRAYQLDERRFAQHVMNLPNDASMLEPLDVAAWTSNENGYDTKSWDIASQVDPLTSGTPQFRMRDVDPTDYDWSPDFERPVSYANINRTPLAPQAVAGFGFQAVASLDADGNQRLAGLEFLFDGDGQDDVRGFMWEVRLEGGQDAILRGSTADLAPGSLRVFDGVVPSTAYEGRGSWVVDRPTEWTGWLPATTDNIGPGSLSDWERIQQDAQDALDKARATFQLALDELASFNIDDIASRIKEEARVDGVIKETREALEVSLGDANAAITQLQTAAATDEAALVQLETDLTASIGTVSTNVNTTQTALAQLDSAFSAHQTSITSQVNDLSGTVTNDIYTKTETDSQISAQINAVNSTIGGLSATVSTVQTAQNGILAGTITRFDVNGVASGHSTIAEMLNGDPVTRTVWDVDEFYVGRSQSSGDFAAPFVVSGGVVYLDKARIGTADIDTLKLAGNSATYADFDHTGPTGGDGSWQLRGVVDVRVPAYTSAQALLTVNFSQGYATTPKSWGFKLEGGFGSSVTLFESRTGMTATTDYPAVTYMFSNIYNNASTARFFRVDVYWQGEDANISLIEANSSIVGRFR